MTAERTRAWDRVILPVTAHFRRRRVGVLTQKFPDVAEYEICDLGGSKHFWRSVSEVLRPSHVDVVNVATSALDAAGVSDGLDSRRFRFVIYDGRRLDCGRHHYDLLLSNSVIEHVAPQERMSLAAEMLRVSPRIFVQTPAYAFPIDPHFLMPFVHWVPRRLGLVLARFSPWRILSRSSKADSDRYFEETRLLRKSELQALFPTATIHVERWCGWPKSFIAVVSTDALPTFGHPGR